MSQKKKPWLDWIWYLDKTDLPLCRQWARPIWSPSTLLRPCLVRQTRLDLHLYYSRSTAQFSLSNNIPVAPVLLLVQVVLEPVHWTRGSVWIHPLGGSNDGKQTAAPIDRQPVCPVEVQNLRGLAGWRGLGCLRNITRDNRITLTQGHLMRLPIERK